MASEPRRTRVERNIYKRPDGVYELGMRFDGVQRWITVGRVPIKHVRTLRDAALANRNVNSWMRAQERLGGFLEAMLKSAPHD